MSEEKVIFYVGKQKRFGYLNKVGDGRSVVICLHGLTGNKDFYKRLPEIFSWSGLSTFRYDSVGHGESEGNMTDYCLTTAIEDLNHAIDTMKTEGFENIGVLAHSFSGAVAIVGDNENIKCIGLINPTIFLKNSFLSLFDKEKLRELERKGYVTYKSKSGKEFRLGERFFEEIMKQDLIDKIKQINKPIFFVLSGSDEVVDPNQSKIAFKAANEPKRIEIIEKASHSFNLIEHEKHAFEVLAIFFKKWLS